MREVFTVVVYRFFREFCLNEIESIREPHEGDVLVDRETYESLDVIGEVLIIDLSSIAEELANNWHEFGGVKMVRIRHVS